MLSFDFIDVNASDYQGRTPLHYSVKNKALEITQQLLEKRADPNLREYTRGISPADLAIDDPEALKLMLDYGGRPMQILDMISSGVLTRQAMNALMVLMKYTPRPESSLRFDCSIVDEPETPPVAYELYRRGLERALNKFLVHSKWIYQQEIPAVQIFESLSELGCDLNTQDDWDRTPLHYAAFYKQHDVIEFLIRQKVDPLVREEKGFYAVDLLPENDSLEELLLAYTKEMRQKKKLRTADIPLELNP